MEMQGRESDPVGTEIFFGHVGKFRLEQPVQSLRDNLRGITLATDNRAGRKFILRVKDGKKIVVQSTYDVAVNNQPNTFYFPAISASIDKIYTMEIIVPNDPSKKFKIGFFGATVSGAGDGTLLVNGVDSKSLLYYRPVYGLSAIEKLGLMVKRISIGKPSLFSATGVTLLSLLAGICSAIFFGSLLRESVPRNQRVEDDNNLPFKE